MEVDQGMVTVAPEESDFLSLGGHVVTACSQPRFGIGLGVSVLVESVGNRGFEVVLLDGREDRGAIEGDDFPMNCAAVDQPAHEDETNGLECLVRGRSQPTGEPFYAGWRREWIQADTFTQRGVFTKRVVQVRERGQTSQASIYECPQHDIRVDAWSTELVTMGNWGQKLKQCLVLNAGR